MLSSLTTHVHEQAARSYAVGDQVRTIEKVFCHPRKDVLSSDVAELCSGPGRKPKRSVFFHIKTLFLFTKSDFKTVIFPQTIFALAAIFSASGLTEKGPQTLIEVAPRIPHMLSWIWLNLLVEDIANQRPDGAIVEDRVNKPWRPLPSGRISKREARNWLMTTLILAISVSCILGAFTPSICLMAMIYLYNDIEGSSSDIWLRNALNAAGLMCFSWGSLAVLAKGSDPIFKPGHEDGGLFAQTVMSLEDGKLTERAYVWILITGAIITTTVHAQDMPDMEGDALRGRKTVPLLYGQRWARWSLAVGVIFWSAVCPALFDDMPWWSWIAPCSVAGVMAVLTTLNWGQVWDEVAWKLWCLWVAMLYLLPLFSGSGSMLTTI